MLYHLIPGTEIKVSALCLGTMTFGSPVSSQSAIALIKSALDQYGINFIDTANMYEGYARSPGSAGGVAETIVGEAVSGRRADYVIATKLGMKVGAEPVDENTSPEAIRIQLRRSLKRLGTDYVDIYYLHRYDKETEPALIARQMGAELRAGTIRAWGVSNYTLEQLAALLRAAKEENIVAPALCQPSLSLLNQGAVQDILPFCRQEGIGVVPYQILQGGLLTGKYRKDQKPPEGSRMAEKPDWLKPMTEEVCAEIEVCAKEAKEAGISMTQYALRWALHQPAVISALIGVKRNEQLAEAAAIL